MFVRGFPGATIDGIQFVDCNFQGVETTEVLDGAGTIVFRNVTIAPARKTKALNSPSAP
jgi:hypothetical protein